ncbi:MAG: RNB domain-containing ribonuclease, partial [Alphaproteobacteria bacterium]|nr:RNB domain-containing ribonuclease [Alphaproteobacteria bacterium]
MVKKQAPIPSMEELMDYLSQQSGKVGKREVARAFGLKGDDKVVLKQLLKSLKSDGQVFYDKGKRLAVKGMLPERTTVEITGTDSDGELIARPLEWSSHEPMPQIIIVKDKLNPPAGVGDIVQAKLTFVGHNLYEGEALRRLTAGENHMVCVFENGFVTSVDRRLKQAFRLKNLPVEKLNNRDIVIADIPMVRSRFPEATFVRKIGSETDPYTATLISIYLHNLPVMFSKAGENEAAKATVPVKSKHREDLTAVPFVTIDGADARDFDDAVWAEPDTDTSNKGGWHIMVAIADVAWYVRSGDALDMDARMRGNSVYFPDRVIPMLPEALSNKMCSLQPNQKRAALVCEAWIDKTGHKIRHTFRRALIKSARRLTYDEVQSAMDGKTPVAGLENELNHLMGAYEA